MVFGGWKVGVGGDQLQAAVYVFGGTVVVGATETLDGGDNAGGGLRVH